MTGFFQTVGNFFSSLWTTITLIFDAIKECITFLGNCASFVGDVFLLLPAVFYVALVLMATIFIVYKIVGR